MSKFTSASAMQYARDGRLEEWVHEFLRDEGKNIPLSDGLRKQQRFWLVMADFPLKDLQLTCGTGADMPYRESSENWEKRADDLVTALKQGWDAPPIIVEYQEGRLLIRDGNHRYEALQRFGKKSYSVLLWCNSKTDFESARRQVQ